MKTNDNLSEYANPELYDLENQDFEPDGLFLLDFAKKLNGPVLEVGCGTGRITIPLAQNHMDITGLDVVPEMIWKSLLNSLPEISNSLGRSSQFPGKTRMI